MHVHVSQSSHFCALTDPFIERVHTSASEVRTDGPQIAMATPCWEAHYQHVRVPEKEPFVCQWMQLALAEVDDPARPRVSRRYQRMSGLWRSPEDSRRLDRSVLDPSLSGR